MLLLYSVADVMSMCRSIILDAFNIYPEWEVTDVSGHNEVSTEASSSIFHWGEYEGIDWERVHSGRFNCCQRKLSRNVILSLS